MNHQGNQQNVNAPYAPAHLVGLNFRFRAGNYYYVGRFLEVLDSVSGPQFKLSFGDGTTYLVDRSQCVETTEAISAFPPRRARRINSALRESPSPPPPPPPATYPPA
ncbi:hypothetical protein C8Q76DRAFT_747035 [Earliella scabrosa]|nr:hypothetical protein C8Q76DRAFT_747035 [Earliella scabrosa]